LPEKEKYQMNEIITKETTEIPATVPVVLAPLPFGLRKTEPLAVHCLSICGKNTVCLLPIEGLKINGNVDTFLAYDGKDVCATCHAVVTIFIRNRELELEAEKAKKLKAEEAEITAQKLAEEKQRKATEESIEEPERPKRGRKRAVRQQVPEITQEAQEVPMLIGEEPKSDNEE
jgi:hypothetical protein